MLLATLDLRPTAALRPLYRAAPHSQPFSRISEIRRASLKCASMRVSVVCRNMDRRAHWLERYEFGTKSTRITARTTEPNQFHFHSMCALRFTHTHTHILREYNTIIQISLVYLSVNCADNKSVRARAKNDMRLDYIWSRSECELNTHLAAESETIYGRNTARFDSKTFGSKWYRELGRSKSAINELVDDTSSM